MTEDRQELAASAPRAALIGVTGYGRVHFQELQRLHEAGRLRLAAATVINPDEAPEACAWLRAQDTEIFDDYTAMLEQWRWRLDLCCVPTGISWHRPMVEAALRAGAHVLVEKPLAGCMEDAEAIIAAAEKTQRWVAVGFQAVWSPAVQAIKNAVSSGRLGAIQRISVSGCWPRPQSYFSRNAWAGKVRDAHGIVNDSPANNAFAHFLNLPLYFSSPAPGFAAKVLPGEVTAEKLRANPIETYDTVLAHLTTDTGTKIFYGVTHACADQHHPIIRVRGEKGRAVWTLQGSCGLEIEGQEPIALPDDSENHSRQLMFDALTERLSGAEPGGFVFPAHQALRHVEAVAAINAAGPIIDRQEDARTSGDAGNPVRVIPGIEQKILTTAEGFVLA